MIHKPPLRHCSACMRLKPQADFRKDRRLAGGFSALCRSCRDHRREANRVPPAVSRMLSAARSRAKAKGLPFDVTADDIAIPAVCPALHVPLIPGDVDQAPSLDRIEPSKGYVRGNVIVISTRANRIKNDATADELHDIAEFVNALNRGFLPPRRR